MPLWLPDPVDVPDEARDAVDGFADDDPPAIVSLSDVHGYLDAARSALLTLSDHPGYDPIVRADADGTLHWAGGNYVLVFNGDLVDRGPEPEGVLELVGRLFAEAPPGRVRVTLGNHEAIMLSPDYFGFDDWYAGQVTPADRMTLHERIREGHVVAAYGGYNVTYAHAGAAVSYDVTEVNEALLSAAAELDAALGTDADRDTQRAVLTEYDRVLGVGERHLKGLGAGLVWLDLSALPPDAPPQVVGHTRQHAPTTRGQVHCQNVIRETLDAEGGEAVFVEHPDELVALVRMGGRNVATTELASWSEG